MPRTPEAAVEWASVPRSGYGGMCLQFTRNAYDVGSYYSCARDAWKGAAYQHPLSGSNLSSVPYGAPLFMDKSTSTYGHVAVYAGGGRMCTTDSQSTYTRVDSVQSWLNAGYYLLGWTEDLNGVRVLNTDSSATGEDDDDMPLNDADKQWITDTVRGLVRDQVLQILRADEFLLSATARKGQTQSWVLSAKVSDDTGTMQQTVRDTRRIARSTQQTIDDALDHVAGLAGVSRGHDE